MQSQQKGFKIISPIIEHPSRLFENKENISYTKILKIKWDIVSIFDFLKSIFILFCLIRKLTKLMIGKEKRIVYELMENANAIFMKGGGLLQTYGGISATYSIPDSRKHDNEFSPHLAESPPGIWRRIRLTILLP